MAIKELKSAERTTEGIVVRLTPSERAQLDVLAADWDRARAWIIRRALQQVLEQYGAEGLLEDDE